MAAPDMPRGDGTDGRRARPDTVARRERSVMALRPRRGRPGRRLIWSLLVTGVVLAGCASDPDGTAQADIATDTAAPAEVETAAATDVATDAGAATETAAQNASGSGAGAEVAANVPTDALDAANFDETATGRNPYHPLTPGQQSVREGSTAIGGRTVPHQVTTTITDVYREIADVPAVAVLDHEIDAGQVTQISVDYMAEDKAGNVWLLGSYTEQYEGGQFVAAADAWMHGVNGAEAGVLVHADPQVGSPPYVVAKPDPDKNESAQVVEVGTRHCVPFDCFDDVLVVQEGKGDTPDNEFKYYARGVGQIGNEPQRGSRGRDVEEMINLTTLSRAALAESSKEALRLDQNAPEQAPAIFGDKPVGERVTG